MTITAGRGQGAAGTIAIPVLFRNTGGQTCHLQGYPGIAGLDRNGRQLTQAVRDRNFTAPSLVTLASGMVASAMVSGSDVPRGNASSCPSYPSLLVTPPGETHSIRVAASLPGCAGLSVRPVVAGSGG